MKRSCVAVLAMALAVSLGLPPAPAAQGQPSMVLTHQPAWVPPGDTALLKLRLEGPIEGLDVDVTAHRAVTSRSFLARAFEGERLGVAEASLSLPATSLPLDVNGDHILAVGIEGPAAPDDPNRIIAGRTGVYPLTIELRRPGGPALDRFVSPLVVVAPGLVPLALAWVWRLDATPAHTPEGDIRSSARSALEPDGRLPRMVSALAGASDVPLTLAPTPETLEAWAEETERDQDNPGTLPRSGLAALRAAAAEPTRQVLDAPYVPVDLPRLLAADLASEADRQFTRGREVLAETLGRHPRGTVLAGHLDEAALSRLRRYEVERLVVPPEALTPLAQRLTPGRPFGLKHRPDPFPAAVADPGLASLLHGDDPPALQAARFLAAISLVAFEAPREERGVVVVTPPEWNPPDVLLDAVLSGLRSHPAVIPKTLDAFFADVAPEAVQGRPLIRNPAEASRQESRQGELDPDSITRLRRRQVSFAQVVGAGAAPDRALDRAVLLSQAAPPAGRLSSEAYLAAARDVISRVTGNVRGPDGQQVTLTARRASIPISLLNANDRPLQVLVRLDSGQLTFPNGSERLLTLGSQNTTESFTVETRAPGSFPLSIIVTSPDRSMVVNRSELTIRSTVVSGVGAALTAGAGIFLLVWWANDLRRSRQRRRRAGSAGDIPAPPGPATPGAPAGPDPPG